VFAKKIPNIFEENGLSFAECFNIMSNGVYHINMFHVPYEDIFWFDCPGPLENQMFLADLINDSRVSKSE
jgi:hypothetical protein